MFVFSITSAFDVVKPVFPCTKNEIIIFVLALFFQFFKVTFHFLQWWPRKSTSHFLRISDFFQFKIFRSFKLIFENAPILKKNLMRRDLTKGPAFYKKKIHFDFWNWEENIKAIWISIFRFFRFSLWTDFLSAWMWQGHLYLTCFFRRPVNGTRQVFCFGGWVLWGSSESHDGF